MKSQEELARARVRRIVRESAPRSLSRVGSRQYFRQWLEQQSTERLIEAASEGDGDALDLLRVRAREARLTGAEAPHAFHAFVWECFIDGPPKAPPGPSPKSYVLRNMIVPGLVKALHEEFGLPLQRNTEHRDKKTGPLSACALVAQELGMSESTVADLWAKRTVS